MDQLDWVHQWDQYEMVMYVSFNEGDDGILMQVSERKRTDGAEQWETLYHRKLSPLPGPSDVPYPEGTPEWEERVLRDHLHQHPKLVQEEKDYLAHFLADSNRLMTDEDNGDLQG